MPSKADTFITALHTLEESRDAGPISALFAFDADTSNPLVKHSGEGKQGAEAFWTGYRSAFETIRSEFRNIVEDEHVAILEWVSEGTSKEGPVRYGGTSVIEHGDDGITAFRAYFDPTQVPPPVKGAEV